MYIYIYWYYIKYNWGYNQFNSLGPAPPQKSGFPVGFPSAPLLPEVVQLAAVPSLVKLVLQTARFRHALLDLMDIVGCIPSSRSPLASH